ncbi:MAG: ABC transporter ATP-binding protein [Thermoleophilia bacterium]|nr:ABC transporter ATP-binding protein [Thermoleophilia bacterium]
MIRIDHLTKVYGSVRAVDDLSLEVHPGEMFGFLGPNGAGKTTTIRILTNLSKPTSGKVALNGSGVAAKAGEVKREFGVVQQHMSLDRELTAWECMELHARLHGIGRSVRKKRIAELMEYVGLTEHAHRIVNDLSGGIKRRLQIARALIHDPRILFLDEPTVGLDAQSRRKLWELIRRMNRDGATVFLTTHYIEEAEELCGRVGVMHQGRLIALDAPLELRRRLGLFTVQATSDQGTKYAFFPNLDVAAVHARELAAGGQTVTVRESNLEDVFIELTGTKVEEGI